MRPSRPPGPYMGGGGRPRGPPRNEPMEGEGADDFDGKRPRKSVMRKTVDYNSSFMAMIERRVWQRDARDKRALQADVLHYPSLLPPVDAPENPTNAVTTKFVKTAWTGSKSCRWFALPLYHTTAQVQLITPKPPLSLFLSWHLEVSRRSF